MSEKQSFTTTIDKDVQNKFKSKCAEQGIKMNDLITIFMEMYSKGEFKLILQLDDKKTIVQN